MPDLKIQAGQPYGQLESSHGNWISVNLLPFLFTSIFISCVATQAPVGVFLVVKLPETVCENYLLYIWPAWCSTVAFGESRS